MRSESAWKQGEGRLTLAGRGAMRVAITLDYRNDDSSRPGRAPGRTHSLGAALHRHLDLEQLERTQHRARIRSARLRAIGRGPLAQVHFLDSLRRRHPLRA